MNKLKIIKNKFIYELKYYFSIFIENIIKHRKYDTYFVKYNILYYYYFIILFSNIIHNKTLIDTDYGNRSLIYKFHHLISKL